MAQNVAERKGPHGADRIYKKRMRAVKRVNVPTAVYDCGPARRLDRSRHFNRQFVEVPLPFVLRKFAFVHQAQQVAVGADVIKTMVVYPDVRDMWRHELDSVLAPSSQMRLITGRIELQNLGAKLKALGPFGPASARVAAIYGEYGRTFRRLPGLIQ